MSTPRRAHIGTSEAGRTSPKQCQPLPAQPVRGIFIPSKASKSSSLSNVALIFGCYKESWDTLVDMGCAVPTRVKAGGQWGITWAEVSESVQDYEARFGCSVEFGLLVTSRGARHSNKHWLVTARAISGRAGAHRIEGYAECTVGGSRGAASFPGGCLRVLIDACEDLERRRKTPAYHRDNPVPDRT